MAQVHIERKDLSVLFENRSSGYKQLWDKFYAFRLQRNLDGMMLSWNNGDCRGSEGKVALNFATLGGTIHLQYESS